MKRLRIVLDQFFKDERGAVIVLVAFLLVFVLIGMAALTVDVGYLYLQKRHLQTTADAAALAAAWELPWSNPGNTIEATALEYAGYNDIYQDGDTEIVVSDPDNIKVKVEITKNYPLFLALAPPIGQTDADVYAMAVATRMYTHVDLLPFLLLEYDEIIDNANIAPEEWDSAWDNWETDRDAFYSLMKRVTPITVSFWEGGNVPGNFGLADMRDFAGLDLNGNPTREDFQYIFKQGLIEPYCEGDDKIRRGRPGYVTSIETSQPNSDGYKLSTRLARDEDFFIIMLLQDISSTWTGNSYDSFGVDDFIIGHFRNLEIASGNKVLEGLLVDVYYCHEVPDEYKLWIPALIE